MNVRISADSTCDLSQALLEEYGVGITPLYIIMEERSLVDGVECTPDDIYDYVKRSGQLCTTSAVTVGDYLAWFGAQLESCEALVHFTISSDMSCCYQNACTAAQDYPGRVFVVDSRSLSTGIGHLVLDAVLLARQGMSGEEIFRTLEAKKEKLNVSFVLETLHYIHKGGRCSGVAALGANLLGLRPCIELRDGKMGVGKKYRGALKKVLLSYVQDRLSAAPAEPERIFITHSGVEPSILSAVEAQVRELLPDTEILVTRAGCTISNHCGPNCLGILYYNR